MAGKFFTRLRAEDASLALTGVSFDEREMYIAAEPETFHITAHYKDYPSVLARIASLDPGTLRMLLERRWRVIAPKKLVRAWDAEKASCNSLPASSSRPWPLRSRAEPGSRGFCSAVAPGSRLTFRFAPPG